MPKFRKKPVEIEAMRVPLVHEDGWPELFDWLNGDWQARDYQPHIDGIVINTLEGDHLASHGDWIIRGVRDEIYPCKPDIFEATYDPV